MKKSFMAAGIALLMTACVGAAIFAIGGAALVNKDTMPVLNSPGQELEVSAGNSSQPADVAQLQGLVVQYQAREQQLKQELAQANAQIQQDQQTLQQVQMLLAALQQRGLIRLTNDGQIMIKQ